MTLRGRCKREKSQREHINTRMSGLMTEIFCFLSDIQPYILQQMNRPTKNKNPYIDLIDSEQESTPRPKKTSKYIISSDSRSRPISTDKPHSQPLSVAEILPRYETVSGFKQMKELPSLTTHYFQLRDFLQNQNVNFLFVFGPSGCGKTLLVEAALRSNCIAFEYASGKIEETEQGEPVYQDLFAIIDESLRCRNKTEEKVVLFKEFPIDLKECGSEYHSKYVCFRENVYGEMSRSDNRNKYIFILNTEIYSPFYLLSENSENRALTKLPTVRIIKIEAYGYREMKEIIKLFIEVNPALSIGKDYDQIITEAGGDARKAFHLIYHRKMIQVAPRGLPLCQQFSNLGSKNSTSLKAEGAQEEEQKVTVFHMLGKFLYGKRYNIYYNPKGQTKKERGQISRYYTEQELKKFDPKFYFRPVQLLDRSHMVLPVFADLLQQNYINRFGSVSDIARMCRIFCYYDSYLGDTLSRFEVSQQMHEILKVLLTWSILTYNRNSSRVNQGMYRIQRCKNNICKSLIQKKIEVIKSHYLKTREGGKYRVKDILEFALMTNDPRYRSSYTMLHQKLIEVVGDNRRNCNGEIDTQLNAIQDEEEDDRGRDNCNRVNQLQQIINGQINRRNRLFALALEDSDESDIDSEPVSE